MFLRCSKPLEANSQQHTIQTSTRPKHISSKMAERRKRFTIPGFSPSPTQAGPMTRSCHPAPQMMRTPEIAKAASQGKPYHEPNSTLNEVMGPSTVPLTFPSKTTNEPLVAITPPANLVITAWVAWSCFTGSRNRVGQRTIFKKDVAAEPRRDHGRSLQTRQT
jgi:hypothetical protein